jgi:hypothetical protein
MGQMPEAGGDRMRDRTAVAVRQWIPLLGVAALIGVAAIAAALSQPRLTRVPPPQLQQSPAPQPSGELPSLPPPGTADTGERRDLLPAWLQQAAMVLCALVILTIIVIVLWVILRNTLTVRRGTLPVDGGPATPLRPKSDEVVAALDAGLAELSDADSDPRRAVIACWVRLEHTAADAGTPRQIGDSPTDLVLRLLNAHRVDRRVLDGFAGLYREARYATHVVDESMRAQAQSALRQLRAELAAPVATAPEAS